MPALTVNTCARHVGLIEELAENVIELGRRRRRRRYLGNMCSRDRGVVSSTGVRPFGLRLFRADVAVVPSAVVRVQVGRRVNWNMDAIGRGVGLMPGLREPPSFLEPRFGLGARDVSGLLVEAFFVSPPVAIVEVLSGGTVDPRIRPVGLDQRRFWLSRLSIEVGGESMDDLEIGDLCVLRGCDARRWRWGGRLIDWR